VAGIACSMVWGVGTSHAEGGSTRRVDVWRVGAAGGAPGVMLMLYRSLEREPTSSVIPGVSPGRGVP
jgi:hypothetical protein